MIRFQCPQCDVGLKAPDDKAGGTVTCPKCRNRCEVPELAEIDEEMATLDETENAPATPRPIENRQGKRLASGGTSRIVWVLATIIGLVMAVIGEVILLSIWAEGNHQLGDEIDKKHHVQELHQQMNLPRLSYEELEVKMDIWRNASTEANREYRVRYGIRTDRFILYAVALGVVLLALPYVAVFFIWRKRV